MTYEMIYEKEKEWKDLIKDKILEEGCFNGKTFVIPLNEKFTKKDREEIATKVMLNENLISSIKTTTTEMTVNMVEFDSIRIDTYMKQRPKFQGTPLPSDYITDEDKSVRWNRDEVEKYNNRLKELKRKDCEFENILNHTFEEIIIDEEIAYVEIFKGIPREIFRKIFNKAYEDGHSYGYNEVKIYFSEQISLFKDILQMMKENNIL